MEIGFQVAVGLICLPLTVLGLRSMLAPNGMVSELAIEPRGAAGLSTIRGVVGGLFLASVVMLVLGLILHETVWFLAVAVLMGVAAVGRLIGVVMDGFDAAAVKPLVVESIIAGVLVGAHFMLGGVS